MIEQMFRTADSKLTKKSVNSKRLFNEIHNFIEEGITFSGLMWSNESHRRAFLEIIEEFLGHYEKDGQIEQWKVICDYRNNRALDMNLGFHKLEIQYRQKNCLNTTILLYDIKDLKLI